MICPYCHEDVAIRLDKGVHRCFACKVELPRDFVERTADPFVSVGLIGDVNHGKTAYLTSLFFLLKHLQGMWPNFYFRALDDYSHQLIYEKVSEFENSGKLQGNTPENFSAPALFHFANVPAIGDCFISFYDVSGETYRSIMPMANRGRSVAQSDIIIFLISLVDAEGDWHYSVQKGLDVYIDAAQHKMQLSLKNQDLVVALTKADLLQKKLPKELQDYISSGAIDKYGRGALPGRLDCHEAIKAWLSGQAGGFVNMAEKHFQSVTYTALSATGAKTSGVTSVSPVVVSDPKRVLDPFVHLIHCVQINRKRFVKKRAVRSQSVDPSSETPSGLGAIGKQGRKSRLAMVFLIGGFGLFVLIAKLHPSTPPTALPEAAGVKQPINTASIAPKAKNAVAKMHKGKVVFFEKEGYNTYIKLEENGKYIWAGFAECDVNIGDTIVFQDTEPLRNFRVIGQTLDEMMYDRACKIVGKEYKKAVKSAITKHETGYSAPNSSDNGASNTQNTESGLTDLNAAQIDNTQRHRTDISNDIDMTGL